ncbi:MAG: pyridoxamine 5'-phosphate oxidase family protein [Chloroflexota bacterium]
MALYHEGERAVQAKAGMQHMADRVGGMVRPTIPRNVAQFVEEQSFLIIGTLDSDGRVWASLVGSMSPFVSIPDAYTLEIDRDAVYDERLLENVAEQGQLGMIIIDLSKRARMRINGTATLTDKAIKVIPREVYGNCQKYIQSRHIELAQVQSSDDNMPKSTSTLTDTQMDWIQNADTFFIASAHQEAGVDVSHRGGMPGFVRVEDDHTLIFPDYSGNMMFNTLGNIAANPKAGLVFIDFESGSSLQLSGEATIIWDETRIAEFAGAERLVQFKVTDSVETPQAIPFSFEFETYSRFNPR